jgi:hypothetical protein
MTRKLPYLLAALVLAGCGPSGPAYRGAPLMIAKDSDEQQTFSYMHWLQIAVPHDAVKSRFEKERDRCLGDAALHCKLIAANFGTGGYDDPGAVSATLQVALPHDKVAAFEDETAAGADVLARSTRADSIENEAGDAGRKVAQLSKYRDGLAVLAKRPNLAVEDFIRVQSELSKTEADLAVALASQRDVRDRIARDRLSVTISENPGAMAPLGRVVREAGTILIENAAQALRFAIGAIPWLPLVALGILAVRWLWRIARRRPGVAQSPPG